ncbi:MAG: ribosomal protein S18-alanine N-acetyltransferase [Haloferacaceae archaeon]
MSPTVRSATRADLLDVLGIERASFSNPWPYAAFESALDEAAFLVACADDDETEVLGYLVGSLVPNHGRGIGHVKDLAVRPTSRGHGVGRLLLTRGLERLRRGGAATVKLEVRESNGPARSLYRDAGFTPARRVPRYYDDGEDAVVMTLDARADGCPF